MWRHEQRERTGWLKLLFWLPLLKSSTYIVNVSLVFHKFYFSRSLFYDLKNKRRLQVRNHF